MKIKITKIGRAKKIPVRFGPPQGLASGDLKPTPSPKAIETPEPQSPAESQPKTQSKSKNKTQAQIHNILPSTSQKRHRRINKALPFLAAIIFTALLVFAGLKIYQWYQDDQNNRTQQAEAEASADGQEVESEGELVNPPTEQDDDYWYYAKMPFYEVNFADLLAKNSDTVAFIHMNDSYVNYPVVQTTDNDYYLFHAFDHSYNDAGWVFMDYRSVLPSDNTVIYGHGRWNGTVFGTLKNALEPEWQQNKDNYVIWLSTPTENFLYQIFAVYVVPAENYYLKQNFASPDDKTNWLATMKSRNVAPVDVSLNPNDSILTLSTCLDDFDNRVVVQARLIKRQAR